MPAEVAIDTAEYSPETKSTNEPAHSGSVTIQVERGGRLGIVGKRSDDPVYKYEFSRFKGGSDPVRQLLPGMLLKRVNGVDQHGLSYDEVRDCAKARPITLEFGAPEEHRRSSFASAAL